MARPLRLNLAGAFYHVIHRGNYRQKIFLDDTDRKQMLARLRRLARLFRIQVHAYCLLDNHIHLILETRRANLSSFGQRFFGSYTQWFNRRRRRVGHLFQGRFKAVLVEKEGYLAELSRYIHLNPVRAGLVKKPKTIPGPAWGDTPREDAGRNGSGSRRSSRDSTEAGKPMGNARRVASVLMRRVTLMSYRQIGERLGGVEAPVAAWAAREGETRPDLKRIADDIESEIHL